MCPAVILIAATVYRQDRACDQHSGDKQAGEVAYPHAADRITSFPRKYASTDKISATRNIITGAPPIYLMTSGKRLPISPKWPHNKHKKKPPTKSVGIAL